MSKNKQVIIISLSALVIIATVVFISISTGVLNTAFHSFSKPITNADEIKNTAGIVEMELYSPSELVVSGMNKGITEGKAPWSFANDAICYEIRYKSDNYTVKGFICLPADYLDKEYPILIYNRGGNNTDDGSFGLLDNNTPYVFARAGFIVLATQYRGQGAESGKDEFGGGDVQDVIALIDLTEKFAFSNGKIYMFGWSRGATETYLVLSRDNRITAAVAGAGPTDLSKSYEEREDAMKLVYLQTIGGRPDQLPNEYKKRSAIYWADKINTPLLIAQGTKDWRVPMYHSVDLYNKMKGLGKDVELKIYEGEDHDTAYSKNIYTYLGWLLSH